MLIAQFSEVSKSFGSQDVVDNIHWQIQDRSRVALVGRNGAGKTTLFRLLTGELEPDRGNIWRQKGAVIAAMEQEVRVDDRRTLRDEAAEGLEHVKRLHREFEEVTHQMGELREGDPESEEILDRYAHLQDRLEREGGYTFESQVRSVLTGLHFTEDDLDRPLREFSGGQKSRAALARVLLRDPDLLLLDEPTNHLDLAAIEWLENFLIGYQGAFVLVSHDRMFVNRLAKGVVELRQRKLHQFVGNYDDFLAARTRRLEEQAKHYELQRAEIKRQEEFIRKNIAGQKTKQAQSRRKMLAKLKRIEEPEWPASSIRMRLPEAERSARIVVDAKDLAKSYGPIKVFRDVSFQLLRGQKLGLIGPNGVGKTTLARLLIGEESQDTGTLRIGPGVQIGYAEQEQASLTGSQSVLDEVWAVTPQATEGEIRGFLGGFLFRGDDVFKPMSALSGGERSRVALAKLVREGANLLVLDEPTNHLDVESREVIESALRSFTGTVLAVSHDRYFLDHVVDHVLELRTDGCRLWEGGYSQFARARAEQAVAKRTEPAPQVKRMPAPPAEAAPKVARVQNYQEQKRRKREEERLRKRVQRAEGEIDRLEEKRQRTLMEMAEPELATQAEDLERMDRSLKETEKKIGETISEWERFSMRLEAFLDGPN